MIQAIQLLGVVKMRFFLLLFLCHLAIFAQIIYPSFPIKKSLKLADLNEMTIIFVYYNTQSEDMEQIVKKKIFEELVGADQIYANTQEVDLSQYNELCSIFGLKSNSDKSMFVLYFNKKAVQFTFDDSFNFFREFRNLGLEPLDDRLKTFLKFNPHNHAALGSLFNMTINKYMLDDDLLDNELISMIKTFKIINNVDEPHWMGTLPANYIFMFTLPYADKESQKYKALKESIEFQKELNIILSKILYKIKQNPYYLNYYLNWAGLAMLAKKPEPRQILFDIQFPPGWKSVQVHFSVLANPFFFNKESEKGFQFLNDIEDWMDTQIMNGANFLKARYLFAIEKGDKLIEYKRYAEFADYLIKIRPKLGPEWSKVTEYFNRLFENKNTPNNALNRGIRDMTNRKQIDEILKLSFEEDNKKYFNSILLSHNFPEPLLDSVVTYLSQNKVNFKATQDMSLTHGSWMLKNANVFVAAGTITFDELENIDVNSKEIKGLIDLINREERKYLNTLEKFIAQNPDNHEAMNMYCLEAEKYLPNEDLEKNIFKYSAMTRRPISLEAYSKMTNKDNWIRLSSAIIFDTLNTLKDEPIEGLKEPLQDLSKWEDLNLSRNSVDWYGYFKHTTFWRPPMYYMKKNMIPEVVFIKFLRQAERASDWTAILSACEARFDEKKDCQNDWILKTWTQAEAKQKR
jgi:hypothetical protein